jgi:hypothetical protein
VKKYQCVFTYSNGHTRIDVTADDAQGAIKNARHTVSGREARTLEIFDSSGLVLRTDLRGFERQTN